MALDAAEIQILQDLAMELVNKELGPLLTDLISKLPAQYAPIVAAVESVALPAIQTALLAEIAKI